MSLADDYFADNAYELEHGKVDSVNKPYQKAFNQINETRGVYQCGDYLVIADNWRDAKRRIGSDKYAFKTAIKIKTDENGLESIDL